jgi:hypothetical protein
MELGTSESVGRNYDHRGGQDRTLQYSAGELHLDKPNCEIVNLLPTSALPWVVLYLQFNLKSSMEESAWTVAAMRQVQLAFVHYGDRCRRYRLRDLLTYGAEPFLRSRQLCSHSRTFQHFMEPEGSVPCSQKPCLRGCSRRTQSLNCLAADWCQHSNTLHSTTWTYTCYVHFVFNL